MAISPSDRLRTHIDQCSSLWKSAQKTNNSEFIVTVLSLIDETFDEFQKEADQNKFVASHLSELEKRKSNIEKIRTQTTSIFSNHLDNEELKQAITAYIKEMKAVKKHLPQPKKSEWIEVVERKFLSPLPIPGEKAYDDYVVRGLFPYLAFGITAIGLSEENGFPPFRAQDLLIDPSIVKKKSTEWLKEHFKNEPIICLYAGGGFDLETPFSCCNPDVVVIIDPLSMQKQKIDNWKKLRDIYLERATQAFGNRFKFISDKELSSSYTSKLTTALNIHGTISFELDSQSKTLYLYTFMAGEENFPESPLKNGAHVLLTKLPTFNPDPSFPILKENGLRVFYTVDRDAKDIRGTAWKDLIDYEQIPFVLKKTGAFISLEFINFLHTFNKNFDRLFIDLKPNCQQFLIDLRTLEDLIKDPQVFLTLLNEYIQSVNDLFKEMAERMNQIRKEKSISQKVYKDIKAKLLEKFSLISKSIDSYAQEFQMRMSKK